MITHEFGHTLIDSDFSESIEDIWKSYSEKFPEGTVAPDDSDFVSGYAAKNKEEFSSECLVSVLHSDNHSTIAKEIVKRSISFSGEEINDNGIDATL